MAYQDGGETVAADLAPLCRHDHPLKGQAGWTLQRPAPGAFLWTSPLGGRYEISPNPSCRRPDTCPGPDDPRHDEAAPPGPDTLTMWRPAHRHPPTTPNRSTWTRRRPPSDRRAAAGRRAGAAARGFDDADTP